MHCPNPAIALLAPLRPAENNVALFQSQIEEAQKQIDEHQQAAEEANRKLREISRMAQSITDLQARHEEKHKVRFFCILPIARSTSQKPLSG